MPIETLRSEFSDLFANYNDSLLLSTTFIRTPNYFIGKRYHLYASFAALLIQPRVLSLQILRYSHTRHFGREISSIIIIEIVVCASSKSRAAKHQKARHVCE